MAMHGARRTVVFTLYAILTDRDRWVLELQKRGDLLGPSLTHKYPLVI